MEVRDIVSVPTTHEDRVIDRHPIQVSEADSRSWAFEL